MLYSPLEQFEIILLYPLQYEDFSDMSLTNATLFLIIVYYTVKKLLRWGSINIRLVPNIWQVMIEVLYVFVVNIVKQQAGVKGLRYAPVFFTIFLIILCSNLIGLLPFAFTPTSHIAFTFTIAFSCNLALIFIGFWVNGFDFLRLFVPKGGPVWLIPLIVVIEFLSYLLRTLSLSIRLFANMMAGHTLLHILSSFVSIFLKASHFYVAMVPFLIVIAVIILEIGIAFLQAYVFIVLLSIYLNDSLHPSH